MLSPVKQTVEGMTTPLVSEPSETPCEVPVVETVESQPEPLPAPSLAPEEPMEVIEDVPEDVPPREMEAKVESKEEVMEEDVDRTVSPAEGKLTSCILKRSLLQTISSPYVTSPSCPLILRSSLREPACSESFLLPSFAKGTCFTSLRSRVTVKKEYRIHFSCIDE